MCLFEASCFVDEGNIFSSRKYSEGNNRWLSQFDFEVIKYCVNCINYIILCTEGKQSQPPCIISSPLFLWFFQFYTVPSSPFFFRSLMTSPLLSHHNELDWTLRCEGHLHNEIQSRNTRRHKQFLIIRSFSIILDKVRLYYLKLTENVYFCLIYLDKNRHFSTLLVI